MLFIAGPCVIENEKMVLQEAEALKNIACKYNIDFYFKASFDKANRTSLDSFRGPGIEEGLRILERIKDEIGLKILTDIHEPWQAEKVADVVDVIQIPAFLCRQTDLLVAAAKTGKVVNVKKGQFMAPWDMKNVIKKVEKYNPNIWLTERGNTFGYNTLVVDMTSMLEMKKYPCKVIFDATHSVQKPGGNGSATGGNREYAEYLMYAACALGIDGIFIETHPNPDEALSDGPNMIPLSDVDRVIGKALEIDKIAKNM